MISATACRLSGRNPSLQSKPSACIAFTIPYATGKLVIVAARCDIGGALLWAWQPQLEYPFLDLAQYPIRHPLVDGKFGCNRCIGLAWTCTDEASGYHRQL